MKRNWFWSLAKQVQASNRSDANQTLREIVLFSGTLPKSGAIANCIVRARKVTIPSLHDSEYVTADVAMLRRIYQMASMSFTSRVADCGSETMLDVGRPQIPPSTPQLQPQS